MLFCMKPINTTKILIHMTNVYMFLLNHMELICINFHNSTIRLTIFTLLHLHYIHEVLW